MELAYGRRLREAALNDLRNFWSAHRRWVTICTIVSPFIIQGFTHGWASLLLLRDNLVAATCGLLLSLIGNFLIALWCGAKSLDAALQEKIRQQDLAIQEGRQDPAGEHHLRAARGIVERLSRIEKQVLADLWTRGPIKYRRGTSLCRVNGMEIGEHRNILARLVSTTLVSWERDRDYTAPYETWEIAAGYKVALGSLLFGGMVDGGTHPPYSES
jgi:hypothetical protein